MNIQYVRSFYRSDNGTYDYVLSPEPIFLNIEGWQSTRSKKLFFIVNSPIFHRLIRHFPLLW
jgi:hypothetical protein